jgi:hypothetical protein
MSLVLKNMVSVVVLRTFHSIPSMPRMCRKSFGKSFGRISHGILAVALIGFGMGGCGFGMRAQREPWREEAEQACIGRKEVKPSIHIVRAGSIEGAGTCGISSPLKVSAFDQGDLTLNGKATLGCPMVSKTQVWLEEVVQPAARLFYGMNVVHMRVGSYACRSRNNQRGAKLSEHSFGNALDVMAFKLADGREVSVVKGWRGSAQDQDFLREVFVGACTHFNTVLGPGSDMFHYDHFHLDLARHDPRGLRRVCRPIIKYAPQLNAARSSPKDYGEHTPRTVYKGTVSTPLLSTPLLPSSPPIKDTGDEEISDNEGVEDAQLGALNPSLVPTPSRHVSIASPVVVTAPHIVTGSMLPSPVSSGLRPPQPLPSSGAGLY